VYRPVCPVFRSNRTGPVWGTLGPPPLPLSLRTPSSFAWCAAATRSARARGEASERALVLHRRAELEAHRRAGRELGPPQIPATGARGHRRGHVHNTANHNNTSPRAIRRATSKGRRHGGSATAPPPPAAPLPLLQVTHSPAGPRGALSTSRRSRLPVVARQIRGQRGLHRRRAGDRSGEGEDGQSVGRLPLRALSRPESEL
jgi:hypothetical protein